MTHRLIDCLLCQCENGNRARSILYQQFQQRTEALFPHLEDESFYVYYRVLIWSLFSVGLLTILLTLYHSFF